MDRLEGVTVLKEYSLPAISKVGEDGLSLCATLQQLLPACSRLLVLLLRRRRFLYTRMAAPRMSTPWHFTSAVLCGLASM
jgi:hypothetical protein